MAAGQHLLGLIDEVLDISRIETGSLSLSPEPVDVLEVVDDHNWTVRADHQRLKQVLLNLASNAVSHNRHGGCIRAAAQGRGPGGRRCGARSPAGDPAAQSVHQA
jgi:signal transduction histidine kinase